ncbi:MAG: electron transfer flavoprotein subunit beta/FixA family protein [Bacteroidales bacterium]
MHIIVCISHVPDTTTKIRFSGEMSALDTQGVKWVINPWDDLSLTRAIELREDAQSGVARLTVALVGDASAEPTLRKALAMGADDAIRIDADPADSYTVAVQLAEALKEEDYQLILCGIESSDHNSSAVGGMLAELLNIPSVSSVSSIESQQGSFVVVSESEGGREKVRLNHPFLAVCQKGVAIDPRIPSMRGVMSARTKPLKVVTPKGSDAFTQTLTYVYPQAKGQCRFFDDTDALVNALKNEAKVL